MITPISANQIIAGRTMVTSPVVFGKMRESEDGEKSSLSNSPVPPVTASATKGEKLDINFTGVREYSLNGNKIDYFA